MKLYEGLFLVDAKLAAQNGEQVENEIQQIVERAGGQLGRKQRWDDLRLAYPVKRRKRGTYYLVHFHAEGAAIAEMRSAANLSESILRAMFTVDIDGEKDLILTTVVAGERRGPIRRGFRDRDGDRSRDQRTRYQGPRREERTPRPTTKPETVGTSTEPPAPAEAPAESTPPAATETEVKSPAETDPDPTPPTDTPSEQNNGVA